MLVIDPDECIDCAVCIPECPVNAILPEEDVPTEQLALIKLNAELSLKWPSITKRKAPLPEAEEWKEKTGKLGQLIR
jgi:ferredoxin